MGTHEIRSNLISDDDFDLEFQKLVKLVRPASPLAYRISHSNNFSLIILEHSHCRVKKFVYWLDAETYEVVNLSLFVFLALTFKL